MEVNAVQKGIISPAYSLVSSLIITISCIMVGLSDKKQGGHDMIANTYCIYRE